MLLALLLPDPCDRLCPKDFKVQARALLPRLAGDVGPDDLDLQQSLLRFIGNFANWDSANEQTHLDVGRGLVKAAHPEETPLVVDPFAGGGSIPLEALRLGCETFASDLNPVAVQIVRFMIETIPRNGIGITEEIQSHSKLLIESARKELSEFYPTDSDGSRPIAYLWARTVRCESPDCGAEIPLTTSFWLCKKEVRKRAIRFNVLRRAGLPPELHYEIFEPRNEREVPPPTVTQGRAKCVCCGKVLPNDRVRAQLAALSGGANVVFDEHGSRKAGAILLAVVTLSSTRSGRQYRLPEARDYHPVQKAQTLLKNLLCEADDLGYPPIPVEPVASPNNKSYAEDGLYFKFFPQVIYGLERWTDFFTARQNLALAVFSRLVRERSESRIALALALGKLVDLCNVVCPWEPIAECPRNVLSNGRIRPSWSFAEGVPISSSSASFEKCVESLIAGTFVSAVSNRAGVVEQAAAQITPLPHGSANVWFTDPPYYDAIPYAILSDAFFVWLKRALPGLGQQPFGGESTNELTPKQLEIIDNLELLRGYPKNKALQAGIPVKDKLFFENNMAQAFAQGKLTLTDNGIGCVVFAHKSTEGWEALLAGMIRAGWVVTCSWPIQTEMTHRLRARESAALATSVHLVCRPRPEEAPIGDWADILRELPKRVGDWMERLQGEGIRGADLVFACIGPALEIFSRHSMVETAEGREVNLAEYLEKVWEVVGRIALEQVLGTEEARARNGVAGALEEDARLTALFLWTLQSTNGEGSESNGTDEPDDEIDEDEEETAPKGKAKGFSLIFDVVRRFAQPLGIDLPKWEDRIIQTEKGVVRLIPVSQRTKQLFGEKGMRPVVEEIESSKVDTGQLLLPGLEEFAGDKVSKKNRGKKVKFAVDDPSEIDVSATTLDRVHAAMLLQAGGQSNALRTFVKAEIERGSDFLRLGNALSALYPKGSEEKRLLDAMLLAVPR